MKKRILAVLSLVIAVLMITAVVASANRFFTTGVGAWAITKGTPTIDGVISGSSEGWTGPINIDKTNYATAWLSHSDYNWSTGVYFASDDNGFYVAAMINDEFDLHINNEVQYADESADNYGEWYYADDITIHNGTIASSVDTSASDPDSFGWDGDIFILQMDPLNWFSQNGYSSNDDFNAWYNIALTGDSSVDINRTKFNIGTVSGAQTAGSKTTSGWTFEAFIPWSEIAKDCSAASDGDFNPSVSELAAASTGNIISNGVVNPATAGNTWTSVEIMYVDRYYDEDIDGYATWQRYCTVPASVNGIRGEETDCVSVKNCGIYLQLGATSAGQYQGTGGDAKNGSNATSNSGTVTSSDTSSSSGGSSNSTAKKSTSSDGSAQTFDPGLAVALGSAGIAGAGYFVTRRKFK